MIVIIPNDDFDMCCGNRPNVTLTGAVYHVECGICGQWMDGGILWLFVLMTNWNKAQREKGGEE